MNIRINSYTLSLIVTAFICFPYVSAAQEDTTKKRSLDNYLLTRKGLFGKLAKVLVTDTNETDAADELQRNDIRFQRYRGKIIRHIQIKRLDFGIPISDTAIEVSTPLTRLSNAVHKKTLERIINNNLFFKENDRIQPYLLADNERYLRDLTYIRDAQISVRRVTGYPDSVDILVLTKDILSIGGNLSSLTLTNTKVAITEENMAGTGNALSLKGLYDKSRSNKIGYGAEYIWRNISGSFIDAYFGYRDFNNAIEGNKQENEYYVKILRPLANTYMRWTYALQATHHQTANMYYSDSLYLSDYRYSYNDIDMWAGVNVDASFFDKYVRGQRLRGLIAMRLMRQKFDIIPSRLTNVYDSKYADITGGLVSASIFVRDFYKTQYIFGFGRNEDIPEGIEIGFTTGYTRKQNQSRPYFGLKFERYYFTARQRYLDFTARIEGSLYRQNLQDITLLGNVDYFNRLKTLGQWKQRTFLSAGVTWQINSVLNEPLFLESQFGLPEFRNGRSEGYIRSTIKAESVFYSPLSIASFRFAPFVFYNTTLFTPKQKEFAESKLYTSLGGGIRTRNESLIFGTIELRGYYFPRKNFNNESFKVELKSDLKFKFSSQLANPPDFIQAN